MRLPIDDVLPELRAALATNGRAVLRAPPGAGKTTRVPLALLPDAPARIVMLEPRRLAVRAAAERMAATLGEPVGRTVGYRMRGEARVSDATRIEVVTEGLLIRRLQRDPSLDGVSHLIFDEFHERSLDADLGLALALDIGALRDDLSILVMSATLDAAPVAALMGGAPVVTSEGRAFPVETRWRETPRPAGRPGDRERGVADLVLDALATEPGSALVVLPGAREIGRVAAALEGRLPDGAALHRLHGSMPFAAQRAAVAPAPQGTRKVVLSTAIAETSLTIEGVRVVVDAGLARRARFDPGTGMGRLVTEPASRAEADQRRGRAGRTAPGVCFRDWTRGQEGALPAHAPPEIATADLAGLALALAEWGTADLPFLDPPDPARLEAAQELLAELGALAEGRITDHGRALAVLPLHPRLGHMLASAPKRAVPIAADLAALLSERDLLPPGSGSDIALRMRALREGGDAARRVRAEAKRLARMVPGGEAEADTPGALLALAFPDRIGLRRPGDEPRWLLSGGRGARMDAGDALAGQRFMVAAELGGGGREAVVRLAAPVTESELRALFADRIIQERVCDWSPRHRRVEARERERLGALVLSDRRWDAPEEALAAAAWEGVRDLGLPTSPAGERLRARAALAGIDLGDERLLSDGAWLLPWLTEARDAAAIRALDPLPALEALVGWDGLRRMDAVAPPHIVTPLGRKVPVDYGGDAPAAEMRIQEMFGVTAHPTAGGVPVRLTLLSPAGRPVAVTTDLPGFWAGGYADVRKDMRGRYPRHPWPEDPAAAEPTVRAKRRGA